MAVVFLSWSSLWWMVCLVAGWLSSECTVEERVHRPHQWRKVPGKELVQYLDRTVQGTIPTTLFVNLSTANQKKEKKRSINRTDTKQASFGYIHSFSETLVSTYWFQYLYWLRWRLLFLRLNTTVDKIYLEERWLCAVGGRRQETGTQ
jgi:hypothetical protein